MKTLASYGFATDDPEQIDDIITFEKSELVRACMARLGFTRKICSLKVELAFENFEDRDWVDFECNAQTQMTKIIIGGASDDEESCKSSISDAKNFVIFRDPYLFLDEQTGRIYRILLWVMYNRMAETSELKGKIESFEFGNDLSKYKHLIEGFVSSSFRLTPRLSEGTRESHLFSRGSVNNFIYIFNGL